MAFELAPCIELQLARDMQRVVIHRQELQLESCHMTAIHTSHKPFYALGSADWCKRLACSCSTIVVLSQHASAICPYARREPYFL
jgi:hypothetical protein